MAIIYLIFPSYFFFFYIRKHIDANDDKSSVFFVDRYVDLFTVPTHYLIEDDEANHTFHPSRLMGLFDMFNADSLIDLISGLGAPKRKILVSVPATAYKFMLKDQDDNAPRAPTEEMQPVTIDQKQVWHQWLLRTNFTNTRLINRTYGDYNHCVRLNLSAIFSVVRFDEQRWMDSGKGRRSYCSLCFQR